MNETRLPAWMPPRAECHPGCGWLDLATGLHWLGYAAVPLAADKTPLVRWGEYDTKRPGWRELYNDWLTVWPRAAGVGVVCGFPLDLVVLDADDEPSWQWEQGNLPAVRGTQTRRGGHLHFRHPDRGVIATRTGQKAIEPAPGIKLDVKGGMSYVVAPYSQHSSGFIYQPLGDWVMPVADLPVLPDIIARLAADKLPEPRPQRPAPQVKGEPAEALRAYLRKAGGVPAEGAGSDNAVFQAAAWARTNRPDLNQEDFAAGIREFRPEFAGEWIGRKWRSSRGAA